MATASTGCFSRSRAVSFRRLVVLLAGMVGIWPDLAAASSRELQGAIVILLDTVRPDRLSTYGHTRPTAPTLDRLAGRGVVFEQAISSSPWTLPAVASLLSARWGGKAFVPDQVPSRLGYSLTESFRGAGIETAAFTEGAFVSRHFGFDRGFSVFEEEEGHVRAGREGRSPSAAKSEATGSAQKTFASARDWLAENGERRFFLFIHTYEAHTPYRSRRFAEGMDAGRLGASFEIPQVAKLRKGRLQLRSEELRYVGALYDGDIWECDRQIAELLSFLEERKLLERTLLVVTSDHGEALGEHHPSFVANHGHSLKDTLLRIPLILVNPAERYPEQRITEQVRIVDVLPTVAEILRVPISRPVDGRSLVPLMRGGEGQERSAFGGDVKFGPQRAFVRTPEYKYIEIVGQAEQGSLDTPPPVQLYDLRTDPSERDNVAGSEPAMVETLARRLREYRQDTAPHSTGEEIPAELRERLRSLGYLE